MDIKLKEVGQGGEIIKTPTDVSLVFGFENMPYLAMFGGNLESTTPVKRDLKNDQASDWWGNSLLMEGDESIQFNSLTEKMLNNVSLTSSGRVRIEGAMKKDLEFMREFALIKVSVTIIAPDKIIMAVRMQKPENSQLKDFAYIWDATNKGLIDWEAVISGAVPAPVDEGIFDFSFDESFE